jgi:pimeloyl-ACP methyl ester carboxylesterase
MNLGGASILFVALVISSGETMRFQGGRQPLGAVQETRTGLGPQEPVRPYPYSEKEVWFENKKASVKLAGTLTQPINGGPFPAIILIPGSGAQDRDGSPPPAIAATGHRRLLVIADYLTRRGFGVLRMDKRGVGKSTGDLLSTTSADSAEDVLIGVRYLKSLKEIDPNGIGLVGLSEGGTIAPIAATKSKDIAFVVLMATPGLPGKQALHLQHEALLKAYGASESTIAANRVIYEAIYSVVQKEKKNSAALEKLSSYRGQHVAELSHDLQQLATVELDSQLWLPLLTPWYRFLLRYDPRPTLSQLKCPVLVLNGEHDLQVPYRENLAAIEQALNAGKNRDHMIVHIPDLNHEFQTSLTGRPDEYSTIEETIAPAVLQELQLWLNMHSTRPKTIDSTDAQP